MHGSSRRSIVHAAVLVLSGGCASPAARPAPAAEQRAETVASASPAVGPAASAPAPVASASAAPPEQLPRLGARDVKEIAATYEKLFVLDGSGKLTMYDYSLWGEPDVDFHVDGISMIRSTERLLCALGAGGSVRCWREDEQAWSTIAERDVVTFEGEEPRWSHGGGETAYSTGLLYLVFKDGSVRSSFPWRGATSTPLPVPGVANAIDVGETPDHACAVLRDGSVSCWHQRSIVEAVEQHRPLEAKIVALKGIPRAVSAEGACVRGEDGVSGCFTIAEDGRSLAPDSHVEAGASLVDRMGLRCVFSSRGAACADRGSTGPFRVDGATAVATGWSFACFLLADRTVTCRDRAP